MRNSDSFIKVLISEPARLKKYLIIISVIIFIVVCICVYFSDANGAEIVPEVSKTDNSEVNTEDGGDTEEIAKVNVDIIVDVGGAVVTPGVYTLASGSRVFEAIESAGGLTKDADTKDINQAAEMADGDRIYVPTEKEVKDGFVGVGDSGTGSTASSGSIPGGVSKVNINTADSTGLQVLSGVGPATAEKIIDYRNSNGKFTSIEKLKNVSGIGDKTYLKLKDHICV
jgi:competence protein ComEA